MTKTLRACALVLTLALGVAGTASALQAGTVRTTTTNWAPYYDPSLKGGGVVTRIAKAAFAAAGHAMTVEFMPWKRVMWKTETGDFDAVMGAYYSKERDETFLFSDPFFEVVVGIMGWKDQGLATYDSLEDLKDFTIGYNDGWVYGEAFESAHYLKKDPAYDQTRSVRKFFGGRVDMVAMARGIFRHEVSKLPGATLDDVVFLEPPLMVGELHIMFSPELENAETLRQDFNAGLAEIRNDGTYAEILAYHGF